MSLNAFDWISRISSILGFWTIVGILAFLALCGSRIYYVYRLRDARRDARERIQNTQDEIRSLRGLNSTLDSAINEALGKSILDQECLDTLSETKDSLWFRFSAFFRADPCLRFLEELEEDLKQTLQRMTDIRLIILGGYNAPQTDAAVPTAETSSRQTLEAGSTRQPAESARIFSSRHSTATEFIRTSARNFRHSPRPEILALGEGPGLHLRWRSPTTNKATDGEICALPMPIPEPSGGGSSGADDEPWSTTFSNLHITDSPSPMSRATSRRGGGSPQPPQIAWSHPSSPQRDMSRAATAGHGSLPTTSSFNPSLAFLMPGPAALFPFPVAEPTGYVEESDHGPDTPSQQPLSQRTSPGPVYSPIHKQPTLVPTPPFQVPHATFPRPLAVTRLMASQGIQPSHQPSPGIPGTGYGRPLGPPPSHPVSSQGAVPSSPPHLSPLKKDKEAVRHQPQELRGTAWPSADQEKEQMKATWGDTVTSEKRFG